MVFKNKYLSFARDASAGILRMLCACVCVAGCADTGAAQAATVYEVKAAFIFNFMRFSEWPAEASKDKTLRLCLLGRDAFGDAINGLQGKTVQGRELQVRRVASVSEAQACSAVYVAPSEEARLSAILAALAAGPVLTLSDIDRFAERGGMIALALVDERVRFDVNLAAARERGLHITSQVLKLARRVIDTKATP